MKQKPAWLLELNRLTVIFVLAFLLGWLLNEKWLFVSIGLSLYAANVVWQFRKLDRWFNDETIDVPEAAGAWGSILDKAYNMQRKGSEAKAQLQAIINRSRASINAFQEGVLLVDAHSNLDWWNKTAGKMLGLQYPKDVSQPMVNLIREPGFKDYFFRKSYLEPMVIKSPDNEKTLQIQFTLFGDEERLLVVRDISRIQRLEQVRSDFVANVSHELKTPLTVIRGYLETFFDQIHTFDRQWHRPVKSMGEQAMRMDALVDDLLLLSKLESSDQLHQELKIDLAELIQGALEECTMLAEKKNQLLQLKFEQPVTLLGAYNEIRSAIINLIVNAIKYTPEQGTISVSIEKGLFEDSEGVAVIVEDNGFGIEEKHLSRLTERFYRVDRSRSLETGGTGLGLAIVKHVLLRHQGALEIESKYGVGSRFICWLPNERVLPLEAPAQAPLAELSS